MSSSGHRRPMIGSRWLRCLLVVLGAAEVLMVAGAAPVLLAVGVVGGVALVVAGAFARSRGLLITLVVVGTVPFAVLGWAAIVPVLLLLTALSVTAPLARRWPRANLSLRTELAAVMLADDGSTKR